EFAERTAILPPASGPSAHDLGAARGSSPRTPEVIPQVVPVGVPLPGPEADPGVGELACSPAAAKVVRTVAGPAGGRGAELDATTPCAAPSVKRRLRRKPGERPLVRERPCCPVHAGPMLVGRTVGRVQYRYCRVPGCRESCTTLRALHPHKGHLPEPTRRVG
ncbi:MAG: hypothetical protein ACKOJF_07535, partial [Planctomycetaceae bacterium]